MAENLAQRIIQKNKQVLWQVSSDKKTPLEIAKQHRLVNAVAKLEQLQVSFCNGYSKISYTCTQYYE